MSRQYNTRADNSEDNFIDAVMNLNRGMTGQFGHPVAAAAAPGDGASMILQFSEYKEQSLALAYKMQRILDQKQLDCQALDADVARLEKELDAKTAECSGFASQISKITEDHGTVLAGIATERATEKGTLEQSVTAAATEIEQLKTELQAAQEAKEAADAKVAELETSLATATEEKTAAEARAVAAGAAAAGLPAPAATVKNSTEQGDAVSPLKELTAAEAAALQKGLPKGDVEQFIALTEMGRLAKKGRDEGGRAQRQFLAFSREAHLKSNPLLSDILEADCPGCVADPTHHKRLLMAAAGRQDELVASVGAIIAVANSAVA